MNCKSHSYEGRIKAKRKKIWENVVVFQCIWEPKWLFGMTDVQQGLRKVRKSDGASNNPNLLKEKVLLLFLHIIWGWGNYIFFLRPNVPTGLRSPPPRPSFVPTAMTDVQSVAATVLAPNQCRRRGSRRRENEIFHQIIAVLFFSAGMYLKSYPIDQHVPSCFSSWLKTKKEKF